MPWKTSSTLSLSSTLVCSCQRSPPPSLEGGKASGPRRITPPSLKTKQRGALEEPEVDDYGRAALEWIDLGSRQRGAPVVLRKEVIQPQVPLRLPCYDFTPVADPTVVACLLAVGAAPSGKTNSHGVTGGVYKARERIHRGVLIHDY